MINYTKTNREIVDINVNVVSSAASMLSPDAKQKYGKIVNVSSGAGLQRCHYCGLRRH